VVPEPEQKYWAVADDWWEESMPDSRVVGATLGQGVALLVGVLVMTLVAMHYIKRVFKVLFDVVQGALLALCASLAFVAVCLHTFHVQFMGRSFYSLGNQTYAVLMMLLAVITGWIGARVLWQRDPVLFFSVCVVLVVALLHSMFTFSDTALAYLVPVFFVGMLAAGFSSTAKGSDHAKVVTLFLATAGSFMLHSGWRALAEEYKQSFFEQGYDSASPADIAAAKAQSVSVPIECGHKSMVTMMKSEAYRTYTGRCVAIARDASLKPEKGAFKGLQKMFHPNGCSILCQGVCEGTNALLEAKTCEAK
jgi:hypothetical protein